MKTLALAAVLLSVALSASGCVLVGPPRSSRAAVRSDQGGGKPCPPGHLWSDGQCHSKGKGHDR
jgi:hypothetical protein